ncbi:MAG TPA: metallophosphoesterase [Xanthobacteraceae bacterium]
MRLSSIRALLAAALVGFAANAAPAAARAAPLPFAPGAGQGLFLHVSDLHFDPFADPALVRRLIAAPVEQWTEILRSSGKTGFPRYGSDTTYPLLKSMLAAAKGGRYDYVLNTGDNLSHGFRKAFTDAGGNDSEYGDFVIKTMRFVDRLLKESFPGVPLISTLGNNDSACGDYMLMPNSKMLGAVGRDLPVVAGNQQALQDFAIGGYYTVPHPKVPNHDIVVLSDVFWSSNYRDTCEPGGGDPGSAELAWLEWTLYRARLAGRSVSLVMHIPPGIDSYSSSRGACPRPVTSFWQDAYARRFLALVAAYKDILRGSYAGHTHMDDFRVLTDANGGAVLTTRITPSVSPIFGNNPAFTVLLYSRQDASVADYATFRLSNLAKLGDLGAAYAPEWSLEYTFGQAYGYKTYDPASVMALARAIRGDAAVRATFMRYYAVETKPSINADNLMVYACAQTAMTPDAYAACACPGAPAEPAPANSPPH